MMKKWRHAKLRRHFVKFELQLSCYSLLIRFIIDLIKIITTKTGSVFVYNKGKKNTLFWREGFLFWSFNKGCVDTCTNGKTDTYGPTTITYYCCKTDVCNKENTDDSGDSNAGVKLMNLNRKYLAFNLFQFTIVYLIFNICL
jgi:hypothetical protein